LTIKGDEEVATIGEAEIAIGAYDVFVATAAVVENSRIFVTPKGGVVTQTLSISRIDEGEGFHVTVSESVEDELRFDWLIVEDNIVRNHDNEIVGDDEADENE